jgi:hypothetical protein
MSMEYFIRMYGCYGRSDVDDMYDALREFGRIEEIVGQAAAQEVIDRVQAEERRRMGEETWRLFTEGDQEERTRWFVRCEEESAYVEGKKADAATCRAALGFLARNPTGVYIDPAGDLWHLAEPSPRVREAAPGKLVLSVRTKRGAGTDLPEYTVDRPPGWFAPFGLR